MSDTPTGAVETLLQYAGSEASSDVGAIDVLRALLADIEDANDRGVPIEVAGSALGETLGREVGARLGRRLGGAAAARIGGALESEGGRSPEETLRAWLSVLDRWAEASIAETESTTGDDLAGADAGLDARQRAVVERVRESFGVSAAEARSIVLGEEAGERRTDAERGAGIESGTGAGSETGTENGAGSAET